jgi:two-component system cell cycle sensor histidine kinase/response regulator CckA
MKQRSRLIYVSNWLAALVAVSVAVLAPLGYYAISSQYSAGSLETEAEINSRIFSGFINANPELWRYEQMRLEEILQRRPRSGDKEIRRITDLQGKVIAESADRLSPPLMKRSYYLKDSGVPVAKVEIYRSVLPILMHTAVIAAFGLFIGAIVFVAFRVLPFRALIQAETALRQSEERFRRIFAMSPVGMATVGLDFRFLSANQMLCKMTGYSEQQLTQLSFVELTHPDDLDAVTRDSEKLLRDEMESYTVEARCLRKDDEPLWIHLTLSLVRDDAGAAPYFLAISKDVTAQRNLEKQLRDSQKMQAVGQLAGGIAHDFNNILTAIIGYATLLQMKTADDDPSLRFVQQIISSADRAASLTLRLLAFSRKQLIQPHPIDLNGIVKDSKELLTRIVTEEIELCTALADEDLMVMADPFQINQVLVNLATNARDAMQGRGVLTIATGCFEMSEAYLQSHGYGAPGSYAKLEVSDTGSGIDEGILPRIFEPFFTSKVVGKGTGLGLAVIYGIVKQHRGFIEVSSKLGQGTTFTIYLPLIADAALRSREKTALHPAVAGREAILMVEDDAEVNQLNREILEQAGYRVISAVDGMEAAAKFREHQASVDLVLVDVIMPKMNGVEAVAEMRKIRPEVKVLFTSGYTAKILSERGCDITDINFIAKPAHPPALLKKIRELLQSP